MGVLKVQYCLTAIKGKIKEFCKLFLSTSSIYKILSKITNTLKTRTKGDIKWD